MDLTNFIPCVTNSKKRQNLGHTFYENASSIIPTFVLLFSTKGLKYHSTCSERNINAKMKLQIQLRTQLYNSIRHIVFLKKEDDDYTANNNYVEKKKKKMTN